MTPPPHILQVLTGNVAPLVPLARPAPLKQPVAGRWPSAPGAAGAMQADLRACTAG